MASSIKIITFCDVLTVNKSQNNSELLRVTFAGSELHNLKEKKLAINFEISLNTNGEQGIIHTKTRSTVLPEFKSKILYIHNDTSYMILCTEWNFIGNPKSGGVILSRDYNIDSKLLDNIMKTSSEIFDDFRQLQKITQNKR